MSGVFKRRGFAAHKQEDKRRKEAAESKRGKLFGLFLKDDEADVPLRFLTEEPILWYRHRKKVGNSYVDFPCSADANGQGCKDCDDGDKAIYTGTWLVSDGREIEIKERDKDGKDTGKKKKVRDRLKLFSRGSTDIAKLDRLSQKYGLTSRPWFATKTGTGQSTSYELDRGEQDELTTKQLEALIAQLPDNYKKLFDKTDAEESLYAIVEAQVFGFPGEESDSSDEPDSEEPKKPRKPAPRRNEEPDEEEEDPDNGVQSLDEEDEPEEPTTKRPAGLFKRPGAAPKPAASKPTPKPAAKPAAAAKPVAKPSAAKPVAKPAAKPGARPLARR